MSAPVTTPATPSRIVCFGEVLWDCLPHGRFLGGALLNVAYHLGRLGRAATVVSAVGDDELGRDTLAAMADAGLPVAGVAVHGDLPTGTVEVTIRDGQPSYRIVESVAWDRIAGPSGAPVDVLVHGTLALRSAKNRAALRAWIEADPSFRACDLNLRAPFDDLHAILPFVQGCDLLKLNEEEAARVASHLGSSASAPATHAALAAARLGCRAVVVTLGADGALLWRGGTVHRAAGVRVAVRDTIGAGDAFTAALLDSLIGARTGTDTDWSAALERACRLGAFVAGHDGAQPSYEAREVFGA